MRFCPLDSVATNGTQEPFQENDNQLRNGVNVLRNRDNLFSITSPLDLGRLARPRTIPTPSLHNAVTQLRSCIRCNWAVTLGRKKYFILYI